jgi:hypothetical protein
VKDKKLQEERFVSKQSAPPSAGSKTSTTHKLDHHGEGEQEVGNNEVKVSSLVRESQGYLDTVEMEARRMREAMEGLQ